MPEIIVAENTSGRECLIHPCVHSNHAWNNGTSNRQCHSSACVLLLSLQQRRPVDKVEKFNRDVNLASEGVAFPSEHDIRLEEEVIELIANVKRLAALDAAEEALASEDTP